MAGHARADLAIRRVRRVAGGVADRGRVDARQLPEFLLRAPEAAHRRTSRARGLRKWRLEAMTVHEVRGGHRHPLDTAGQRPSIGWDRPCFAKHDPIVGYARAGVKIANIAPCGSLTTEKRPVLGMSIGGTAMCAPSCLAFSMLASQSAT